LKEKVLQAKRETKQQMESGEDTTSNDLLRKVVRECIYLFAFISRFTALAEVI
jgi:hypothetical protein